MCKSILSTIIIIIVIAWVPFYVTAKLQIDSPKLDSYGDDEHIGVIPSLEDPEYQDYVEQTYPTDPNYNS